MDTDEVAAKEGAVELAGVAGMPVGDGGLGGWCVC